MQVTSVEANLGFTRPGEVIEDDDERGLKRAITRPLDAEFARHNEYRRCHIRDWSAPDQPALNFREMGFESISLARSTWSTGDEGDWFRQRPTPPPIPIWLGGRSAPANTGTSSRFAISRMTHALRAVRAPPTLPATVVMPRMSNASGAANASMSATASSTPGSQSIMS